MNTLPPLHDTVLNAAIAAIAAWNASPYFSKTGKMARAFEDLAVSIAAQAQPAAKALSERFALQHVAYADEDGLHWLSGRHVENCELYAMPGYGNAPALYTHPAETQTAQPTINVQNAHDMVSRHQDACVEFVNTQNTVELHECRKEMIAAAAVLVRTLTAVAVQTTPLTTPRIDAAFWSHDADGKNMVGGCSLEGWRRCVQWVELQHGIGSPGAPSSTTKED